MICLGFSTSAFGHGLGGEMLPPTTIGDRDATLSIDVSPSTFDPNNPENFVTLRLFDSNTEAIIEHVTFILELKKDGERIFRYMFHDELGNLNFRVISDNSDKISVDGTQEPLLGGWMRGNDGTLTLTGPIFTSGGLYEYKVEVLTVDFDDNVLDQRVELEGAISIADVKTFEVTDNKNQSHDVQVISYFDTISEFDFDSNKMSFSMPFDWNQDLEQLSVIHEEVRVPNTFGEFLSTKYNSYANGVLLPDEVVTIDDYSFDDRTVHMTIYRELIKEIKEEALKTSDSKIDFSIETSDSVKFPLEFATPDYRFKVFLSWEPETIRAGEETTFFVDFDELFSAKTKRLAEYDLSVIQNDEEIYKKHLTGNINSDTPNSHSITFAPEHSGSANIFFSNIDGNSLSKGNFIIVIEPQANSQQSKSLESQEIPIWIKNNAGWWANNSIDDETFVQGIQFLIKQNILQVLSITTQESNSNEIPSWIKNNAGWWASDQLDDETFVQGIQYLIKNGIIVVN
ncbi:ATP-dependent DNA ligase AMP-binding site protein [Marine Group I thaumarchaeote SCGC AAA799-B03]|uniref:ATP-dependent DNA ligase AMP-binding site protein n=4 Tax=Marine Group I TaxID=905826 RepID=A0A087S5Z3_9ARCH|nr:ATP-dependent DNA ligase AMP-binding site protein [Marine Group I thaumarchaeote SCGC AAA799-D11]KFM15721.1 ATP-dependent DNA ligase AMP-binding site protein [Marine Group I thaumarchaeote SCGC RSA3]KFM21147.1 ATP-dependent DNA ligase AMP-binding site protein [Marine Group I thaumarchaeote SCGC AAA799-B03]